MWMKQSLGRGVVVVVVHRVTEVENLNNLDHQTHVKTVMGKDWVADQGAESWVEEYVTDVGLDMEEYVAVYHGVGEHSCLIRP